MASRAFWFRQNANGFPARRTDVGNSIIEQRFFATNTIHRQKRMKNAMKQMRGSQYHGDAILWLNSSHFRKSSKWRQANMSEIWTVN
jgi:hypothetical protein